MSKGREAVAGSSFLCEIACIELNPPTPASEIAASLPPQTITSAFPVFIYIKASAIALAEEAQAETVQKLGPLKSYLIEI